MIIDKKRHFVQLPYSNLYIIYGDKPYPKVFIDDDEKVVYRFVHIGFEGPTYWKEKITTE